jgi:hypothetical protein
MRIMLVRRLAGVAIVAASVWAMWPEAHGQTLPGSPVRPAGAPPVGLIPQSPRARAALLGQVVDATSGRGVARAIVRLSGAGFTLTRVADDKGRFYFTDVPDADVNITATKIGFFDGAYGKRRAGGTGVPLTISNSRWATDLRLELFKAAAISGIVVDESNEPLVGVRVRAWRREFAEGREQLVPAGDGATDDEGMYRVFGLKPGDYILSIPSVQVTMPIDAVEGAAAAGNSTPEVSALLNLNRASAAGDRLVQPDGKYVLIAGRNVTAPPPERGVTFAYRTEFYPGFELPSQALPVSVGSGEDRVGVHFQLRLVPTHRVSGIVVGQNGPVARQLLRLVLDGADDQGLGNEAATTITGADGAFTLLNIPTGEYTLRVRPLGAVVSAASPDLPPDLIEDASDPAAPASPSTRTWGNLKLAVHDADVSDVIVGVHPGVTIGGRVVLDGSARQPSLDQLIRTAIGLLPEDRTVGRAITRQLNASGRFAFPDLMPGPYFLRVSVTPPGWSVKSVMAGGRDLLDQPLDLSDDTDVVVTLTNRPTEAWGTVRDWRGVVAAGATILVLPPSSPGNRGLNPNRMREARAATSGVYTISGLPAGDYYVIAIDDASAEGWQDPRRVDALRAQATRVSLRDGEKKLLDLRLVKR